MTVIASASECIEEVEDSILISTELSQFKFKYILNRDEASQYTDLSEENFFKLFFSNSVI